jgi:hypothetical protein
MLHQQTTNFYLVNTTKCDRGEKREDINQTMHVRKIIASIECAGCTSTVASWIPFPVCKRNHKPMLLGYFIYPAEQVPGAYRVRVRVGYGTGTYRVRTGYALWRIELF